MTKFGTRSVFSAVIMGVVLMAKTVIAAPTPVPIVNPNFLDLSGWTVHLANSARNASEIEPWYFNDANSVNLGISTGLFMGCANALCPLNTINSVTQTINSMVHGDAYQLSYYAARFGGLFVNGVETLPPVGPSTVQLGGSIVDTVTAPFRLLGVENYPWEKKTVNFTYTGATGAADLSIVEGLSSAMQTSCIPCAEILYLTALTLNDLGPNGPTSPPTPGVSEPSSIAVLALGLGTMGLYIRRRRDGRHA